VDDAPAVTHPAQRVRDALDRVTPPEVIVVGAGLGGLSAAAELARGGLRVLVLEATAHAGGRCTTRVVEGGRFAVGANTFGIRTERELARHGVPRPFFPAPYLIAYRRQNVRFPFDRSSFRALGALGCSVPRVVGTAVKVAWAMRGEPPAAETYRDIIRRLLGRGSEADLLEAEAWYLGAHPDALPASCLKTFFGLRYGFHRPVYPIGGAHRIPEALVEAIQRAGGEVRTGQRVEAIRIEGGAASGVGCAGDEIPATVAVVSNLELGATLRLADPAPALASLAEAATTYRRGLSFANLLLRLKPGACGLASPGPRGAAPGSTLLADAPVAEVIGELEAGRLPPAPILNVVQTQALAEEAPGDVCLSLLALWPRSPVAAKESGRFVEAALDRLERIDPRFRSALLWHRLVTPDEYEAAFGFSSCPSPVLDSPTYEKSGWRLPVARLYNVGSTVQPRGCHTGSAIDSGRLCAAEILASFRSQGRAAWTSASRVSS
jgi:phytoene dehydrogenase-like protein